MWLKVYNHDLGCKLFNSTRFVLSIPDTLLTFCFTLVSCDMQRNVKKWYLMRMCISRLCPFKTLTVGKAKKEGQK